jgi:hypothetical protein
MRPDQSKTLVQAVTKPALIGKVSILAASLASVLCMAGLFVTVALAAGPHAAQKTYGKAKPAGLCFLHDLVR